MPPYVNVQGQDDVFFGNGIQDDQDECMSIGSLDSSFTEEDHAEIGTDKLYPGSQISKEESTHMIFAFALRHSLSKCAVTDLLTLINLHLPKGSPVPATTYMLEKVLQPDLTQAVKCYYCQECEQPIETDGMDVCANCNAAVKTSDLMRSGKFFMTFDIEKRLQNLLKISTVSANLMHNLKNRGNRDSRALCDIMDGQSYKELNLDVNDFTCCINTDGVNVFESSTFSIWPIFISINELDFKVRSKYTTLVALWFGKSKPTFDTFLKPFIKQCNQLSIHGFEWQHNEDHFKSQVFFPMVAADSAARCSLQGIKQYNGRYSCPWCLASGENCNLDGGSHKWIFPHAKQLHKRTNEQFRSHLRMLKEQLDNGGDDSCFGILNASQFLALKKFNIVDGFVMDYMHTALIGVLKAFTNALFDTKNHGQDFYLGKEMSKIDALWLTVKVPYECNRKTRGLNERPKWKANEWKTWLMVCIPILKGFLSDQYLKHLSQFVLGLSILLGEKLSLEDISLAEKMLNEFSQHAAILYGDHMCTFNMHLLLHAGDCVRKWGPLWSYSLFQYENANGVLTRLTKGTTQVCMQIINKVLIIQQLRTNGDLEILNPDAKKFFMSMMDRKILYKKSIVCNKVTLVGPKRKYTFDAKETYMLCNHNLHPMDGSAWSFKYFFVYGMKFCIEKSDSSKLSNCIICVRGETYLTEKIILFSSKGFQVPIVFAKKLTLEPISKSISKVIRLSKTLHLHSCQSVTPAKHLKIYDANGKLTYISRLLNRWETE